MIMLAAVCTPLLAALLVALSGRWPNVRDGFSVLMGLLLWPQVAMLVYMVLAGDTPELSLVKMLPGVDLAFSLEPLGAVFACVATLLWPIATLYSVGYMRGNNEPRQTQFYVCFAIAISATLGIAFSANLLTLFVFYEALTFSTYPLVTHKGDEASRQAGRKYLGILVGTSVCLLLAGILWTHQLAGSGDFTKGGLLPKDLSKAVVGILLALYAFGIGKAALMPFHGWLPAAMVAPTPVSALLHAVAVVKAGVFTVIKVVVYIFGIDLLAGNGGGNWLIYVAGTTTMIASLTALQQDNLKRRLAFSTIGQLAYVVLAVSIFTPAATLGATLHIAGHAFGKITLFFAAGAIYTSAHLTLVSQLDGVGRRMPITLLAFGLGSLSMIGLPPTAGFLSKFYIVMAAAEAEAWFALIALAVSTVLNAAYFLPIVYRAFAKPAPVDARYGEAPWQSVLALSLTAMLTFAMFIQPGPLVDLVRMLIEGL